MNGNLNGTHGNLEEAALWRCNQCEAWWCSQPVVRPTRFMIALPADVLTALGWDNFRGWRLGGTPHVGTCPECGSVQAAPRFGHASPGLPLRQELNALLAPAMAPARPKVAA